MNLAFRQKNWALSPRELSDASINIFGKSLQINNGKSILRKTNTEETELFAVTLRLMNNGTRRRGDILCLSEFCREKARSIDVQILEESAERRERYFEDIDRKFPVIREPITEKKPVQKKIPQRKQTRSIDKFMGRKEVSRVTFARFAACVEWMHMPITSEKIQEISLHVFGKNIEEREARAVFLPMKFEEELFFAVTLRILDLYQKRKGSINEVVDFCRKSVEKWGSMNLKTKNKSELIKAYLRSLDENFPLIAS